MQEFFILRPSVFEGHVAPAFLPRLAREA